MTTQQFLTILATIYIAPHVPKPFGLIAGLLGVGASVAVGLGWLPA